MQNNNKIHELKQETWTRTRGLSIEAANLSQNEIRISIKPAFRPRLERLKD
jgi:hypothetical protein